MSNPVERDFDGLHVAVFEARMAGSLADLVARRGGVAVPAPALREIPLGENPEAVAFVDSLRAGAFDLVIFETGVGVRYLVAAMADRIDREEWPRLLAGPTVVARGPKPATALRELGVAIDLLVPSPNTWRETLATLDAHKPVAGLRVALQEYGQPAADLLRELEARSAAVTRVPVYRWDLPEDLGPLRAALAGLVEGRIQVALFTSAQQVEHVLQIARAEGIEELLRAAFADRIVVGSVGPTTSEALRAHGLPVDVEPSHPKSGHLVVAVADAWRSVGKVRRPEAGS